MKGIQGAKRLDAKPQGSPPPGKGAVAIHSPAVARILRILPQSHEAQKAVLSPGGQEAAALRGGQGAGPCVDRGSPCLAEAAYTLLLYDELLEWSDRPLREFLSYPMQTEWQRKEQLHLAIIQNFDRGKVSAY